MRKRILSLLFVLVLCLGLVIPAAANSSSGPDLLSSFDEYTLNLLSDALSVMGSADFDAATATDEQLAHFALYCPLPGISSNPVRMNIANPWSVDTKISDSDYKFSENGTVSLYGVSYNAINNGAKNLFGRNINYKFEEEATMPNLSSIDVAYFNYKGMSYVVYGAIDVDGNIVSIKHIYHMGNDVYWVIADCGEMEEFFTEMSAIIRKVNGYYQILKIYPLTPSEATIQNYIKNLPTDSVSGFRDVSSNSPYKDAIEWAVNNKITNGITSNTFGPSNPCTISHILKFLYRSNGSPYFDSDELASAIIWAAQNGMDIHNPDLNCTRATAVTYLWNVAGNPKPSKAANFNDVSSNAPYAQAVAWAVEKGITTGTSATKFSPNATCTRGQIVTFLYRASK